MLLRPLWKLWFGDLCFRILLLLWLWCLYRRRGINVLLRFTILLFNTSTSRYWSFNLFFLFLQRLLCLFSYLLNINCRDFFRTWRKTSFLKLSRAVQQLNHFPLKFVYLIIALLQFIFVFIATNAIKSASFTLAWLLLFFFRAIWISHIILLTRYTSFKESLLGHLPKKFLCMRPCLRTRTGTNVLLNSVPIFAKEF